MRDFELDWQAASQIPVLEPHKIHLWWLPFACVPHHREKLFSRLTPQERARAGRNVSFGYFRGYLRQILDEAYGLAEAKILNTPEGKPFLENHELEFNLSHSGENLLLAFSRDRVVGVDLENIRPRSKMSELVARFFSRKEQEKISALEGQAQLEFFYRLWTQKEAILKARSKTIGSAGLSDLDVSRYVMSTLSFSAAKNTQAALSVPTGELHAQDLIAFRVEG